MTEYLLYLYAESPVHAGASTGVDVLDLPIQREAGTGYPVVWGQSLKGALRQAAADVGWEERDITPVFGSAPGEGGPDAETVPGNLAVGDAQLVAMPVPTLRATFAWMTTSLALSRLARKYARIRPAEQLLPVPEVSSDSGRCPSTAWVSTSGEVLGPCVVLLTHDAELAAWAQLLASDAIGLPEPFGPFRTKMATDLLLVGDDVAPTLLRECTEQTARVQLNADSKNVKDGPFYSEYLPAESLLAASLTLRGKGDEQGVRDALTMLLDGTLLQVGGDETLGKGLVWARLHEAAG